MMFGDDRDPHAQDQGGDLDDAAELDGQLDDDAGDEDADPDAGEGDDAADQPDGRGGAEGQVRGQDGVSQVADRPRKRTANEEIRFQKKLRQDAEKRADQRIAEAERKANEALQAVQQRQTQESTEQRAQRLAAMSDWERAEYLQNETRQYVDHTLRQTQLTIGNTQDEAKFARLCATNPAFARVADEVDRECNRLISQGAYIQREVIAHRIIGESVARRAGQAKTKQGNRGADRIARETTRPANPRGQQAGQRTKAGDDLESRLRGKTI